VQAATCRNARRDKQMGLERSPVAYFKRTIFRVSVKSPATSR
jgi:hypothetical protein